MAKRVDISVILLFNRQAFRADFSKPFSVAGSRPGLQVQESIDAEASLVDAVKAVVDAQPRLAARTIVLATDVWSQIISLPRISIGGMESDELEAALRFEAETLSGIEIDDLSLSYRTIGAVGDFDQFWVNVVRQADLEAVNSLLEKQGCREITLAHPAGFSSSVSDRSDGLIAEFWDDLVYLLSHNGTRLSKVKQATATPAGDCERLLIASNRDVPLENRPSDTVVLNDGESIAAWAAKVATHYAERLEKRTAPVLRKSKLRGGTPVRHLVAAVLAVMVVGFCYWHWSYMRATNEQLIAEIATIKQPARDKKDFDSQIVAIHQTRAEVELASEKREDELERIRFFLDNQNDRIAQLLKLLIDLRKPDLVIQQIDGTEDGLRISGFSINGESAQALAKELRIAAEPLGWMVNPAKQKGQEKLTTGGPWTFRILLTDVGPDRPLDADRASEARKLR